MGGAELETKGEGKVRAGVVRMVQSGIRFSHQLGQLWSGNRTTSMQHGGGVVCSSEISEATTLPHRISADLILSCPYASVKGASLARSANTRSQRRTVVAADEHQGH